MALCSSISLQINRILDEEDKILPIAVATRYPFKFLFSFFLKAVESKQICYIVPSFCRGFCDRCFCEHLGYTSKIMPSLSFFQKGRSHRRFCCHRMSSFQTHEIGFVAHIPSNKEILITLTEGTCIQCCFTNVYGDVQTTSSTLK